MRIASALLALAALPLSGCIFASPRGIWLLTFTFDDNTTSECETTITENFTDGYVPGADSPTQSDWTYTETVDPPDALGFAQIETTAAGQGVLVFGGAAYPGTKEKDQWVFEWADQSTDKATAEHSTGYELTETVSSNSSLTLTMTQSGPNASGVLQSKDTSTDAWTESDDWEDEVADTIGTIGQIPSADWLVYMDDNDNERPQENAYDEDECDGSTCELTVKDTCTLAIDFTAIKTDFHEEAAYAHLVGAGQGSI